MKSSMREGDVDKARLAPPPATELVSSAARTLRGLAGDGWRFDPLAASVRLPAFAAALAVGSIIGHPLAGVLAASGAFTVGFGAPLGVRGSKARLLFAAAFAIGGAAVVGSFAAWSGVGVVLCAAGFGWMCAVAMHKGPRPGWIGLQCALAAVVATTYPASLQGAAKRAAVIVCGALGQALIL